MFNLKLYKEGLRKSLFLAVLFIAIMKIGAVLLPIANIMSNIRAIEMGWGQGRLVIDGLGGNIALVLALCAFAPFITLYLFSFLNKRSSSDFYHSLPHKRETIFISYTAAILTWVIGGIWLSTGISLAIYAFAAEHILLNLSSVLFTALGLSAGCLLVVGATLMAMSVTGGAFANIVTALLIIFLPRTIMMSFTEMLVAATGIITPEAFGIFGDASYHIPFNFLLYFFNISTIFGGLAVVFVRGALYTALIGLAYLVIALFLFKRRKSETAGHPAQSGVLQTMIRIAVAFVVCVLPISMIFMNMQRHHWGMDFIGIVALYAIAIIAYFAYELITTRKIASIKKALPGLGILVLLNIAFLVGVSAGEAAILNRTIQASDIAAVRVESLDFVNASWGDGARPYEERRAEETEITDDALTRVLLDVLDRNIAVVRARDGLGRNQNVPAQIAFVRNSGQSIRRNIWLTSTEHREVLEILDSHPEYADLFLNLPENPEEVSNWMISEEAARDVYEALRADVRALDLATWRPLRAHWTLPNVNFYGELHVRGFLGRDVYRNIYPITDATPRAADRFIYHINAEGFADVEAGLVYGLTIDYRFHSIFVDGYGERDTVHFSSWDVDMQQAEVIELFTALLEAVRAQGNTPVDRILPYLSVQVSHWSAEAEDGEFRGTFFFNADEALIELLSAMPRQTW